MGVLGADVIAAERHRFRAIEKKIDGFIHVPALDHYGAGSAFDNGASM